MKGIKLFDTEGAVIIPPDVVLATRFLNDKLVVGRTARMLSGGHDNGAQVGKISLPVLDDVLA
jgi:hypothetical protein